MVWERRLNRNMWKYTDSIDNADIVITLIRHGLTRANEEKRYIGHTDQPLSDKGREQIVSCIGQYDKPDYLFVSPLTRCLQTAQILFGDLEYDVVEEFKELDFGDFEMRTHEDMCNEEGYKAWLNSNGNDPIPGGESKGEFVDRCMRGFEKCIKSTAEGENMRENGPIKVAMVVHGGTIMAISSSVCDKEYFECMIPNGSSSTIYLRIHE